MPVRGLQFATSNLSKSAPNQPAANILDKTNTGDKVPSSTNLSSAPELPTDKSEEQSSTATAIGQAKADEAANSEAAAAAALEAEAEAERKRIQEAEAAAKKLRGNGDVVLVYEQYNESFPIVDGSTTHANIDDVYCLSFVMPNCLIHVSTHAPGEKRKLEVEGNLDLFVKEDPRGTYHGLEAGMS